MIYRMALEQHLQLNTSPEIIMGSIQGGSPPTNGCSANSPNHPVSTPTAADNQSFKPTACVACRDKHLKCDALRTCTRCAVQSIPCVYLKSRRGYRRPNSSSIQVGLSNGRFFFKPKQNYVTDQNQQVMLIV